jgi:hypothetical protein
MKLHSQEWFAHQVEENKKQIERWPNWMRETARVATTSLPKAGIENPTPKASARKPKKLSSR